MRFSRIPEPVKRTERTYMTPIPQASNLQALNEHFVRCFERDLDRIDTATKLSYGTLLEQERKLFRALPVNPFLACASQSLRVDKRSTVPHEQSRYSVPVQYATKPVVVRAFVGRIEVLYEDKSIAVHDRVAPSDWSLHLAHYVTLLETKPGLLDSGKPFVKQAWTQSQQLFRNEVVRCPMRHPLSRPSLNCNSGLFGSIVEAFVRIDKCPAERAEEIADGKEGNVDGPIAVGRIKDEWNGHRRECTAELAHHVHASRECACVTTAHVHARTPSPWHR